MFVIEWWFADVFKLQATAEVSQEHHPSTHWAPEGTCNRIFNFHTFVSNKVHPR